LAKGAELPTQSPLQEVAAGSCGGGEEEADDAMSPELPLPPVRQQQQGEWKPDSARLMESWLQPSPEASSAPGTEGVQAEAAAAEAAAPREEVEQPSPEAAQAEAAEAARQAAQAEAAAAQSMVEQELLLGDMTIVNPRRTLCGSPNKLEQCLVARCCASAANPSWIHPDSYMHTRREAGRPGLAGSRPLRRASLPPTCRGRTASS